MQSIRTQLVISLISGALVLTCAAAMGLYAYMEEVLEHSLDAELAAKSEVIVAAVHMEDDGQPHLKISEPSTWVANKHGEAFYFQIWRDDGSTVARSTPPAMGNSPLPRAAPGRHHFQDAKLLDGSTVRLAETLFTARTDEDEFDKPVNAVSASPAHLSLVVVHDRRMIDGTLAVLLTGLLVTAVVVSAGIFIIVGWGVTRGLRPLAQMSHLADKIGPDSLDIRFPVQRNVPLELLPIGLKLNELLDRLSTAFARERRFSAAVSHELRTPLAELRSACDVALRWPDDTQGLQTALAEAREVAVQMTTMVQTLLSLTRQKANDSQKPKAESINLASAVKNTWPQMAAAASHRQLTLTVHLADDATVRANPDLLAAVLRNLLENAVDHSPMRSIATISTRLHENQIWSLEIINECQTINAADLPRIFEPFWRADPSRTGNTHVGLGLTLVKAYCDMMDVSIDAALDLGTHLRITLAFPAFHPPQSEATTFSAT